MRLNYILIMITHCINIAGIGLSLAVPAQAMSAFQDKGGPIVTVPSCTSDR
jgi:hypothetical protein